METMPEHRRPKLSDAAAGGGEDWLSALPDDLLIHILLKLRDAPVAARTSVLARRWRRIWALLPELHFPDGTDPDGIRAALAAHDAPALSHLSVAAIEATPESVAAWLPIDACRLSGVLDFQNRGNMDETSAASPLKLPCFQNATKVVLDLDSIGLTLPPSGIFTRLADLVLIGIQLHGPCSLGDVVSSPRCPSLTRLCVGSVKGLEEFTIHSESLLELVLSGLPGLHQLNVVALALKDLAVRSCFTDALNRSQHIANISAPQLRFDHISRLVLYLVYAPLQVNGRFLMEEMTNFPNITSLTLNVVACSHSFGASSFHVLSMSSGVRELEIRLVDLPSEHEALASACQSGCICAKPSIWETEELVLHCLEEVVISGLRGTEHELAFVKSLILVPSSFKLVLQVYIQIRGSGPHIGQHGQMSLLVNIGGPTSEWQNGNYGLNNGLRIDRNSQPSLVEVALT
uniref:F-box domain-containing protein n=1 Tax=Aegilops tauschii TaxID=37682 RepID=M8ASX0_AEGTA